MGHGRYCTSISKQGFNHVYHAPAEEAPCKQACPVGIDVPRYVRLISEGKFAEALAVIREKLPFPSVCGRVCFHPCETACRLNALSIPVPIRALKRFVTEVAAKIDIQEEAPLKSTHRHVAIIGSGPAGLTAAYYLAKRGHSATVFERSRQPGGMLLAIPRFVLPQHILRQEIEAVLNLGVKIKLNKPVERVNSLLDSGYDAVFIAVGAGQGQKLPIPNSDAEGVLDGPSFLQDANAGKKFKLGKKVLVVGGGGVACDVARVSRRLSDPEVHLVCLESRLAMPAFPWEIDEAEKEGVIIHNLRSVAKIVEDEGHAIGAECLKLRWMKFDDQGGLHLDPIEGSEHVMEADTVFFAVGQNIDLALVSDNREIEINKHRRIVVNSDALETGQIGVFAGGDVVSGPSSVIEAIAAGRKAAASIDKYLSGSGVIDEILAPPEEEVKPLKSALPLPIGLGKRAKIPLLSIEERMSEFAEVELPVTEEVAIEQAGNCLRCNLPIIIDAAKCTGCLICQLRCSLRFEKAVHPSKAAIKVRRTQDTGSECAFELSLSDKCDACGLCVKYCPTGALIR